MYLNEKSKVSSAENELFKKALKQHLNREENRFCADCNARGATWASANLGVFICLRCSGIHRSLGVHVSKVRSTNLDTWTREQVEYIIQLDNIKSNSYWESSLPKGFAKPQVDFQLKQFIREKYEFKKYVDSSLPAPTIDNINKHPWFVKGQQQQGSNEVENQQQTQIKQMSQSKQLDIEKPTVQEQQTQQQLQGDLLTLDSPTTAPKTQNQSTEPPSQLGAAPMQQQRFSTGAEWNAFESHFSQLPAQTVAQSPHTTQNNLQNPDPSIYFSSHAQNGSIKDVLETQDPFANFRDDSSVIEKSTLNPQQILKGEFSSAPPAPTPTNTPLVTSESKQSQLHSQNYDFPVATQQYSDSLGSINSSMLMAANSLQSPQQQQQIQLQQGGKSQVNKELDLFQESMQKLAQQGVGSTIKPGFANNMQAQKVVNQDNNASLHANFNRGGPSSQSNEDIVNLYGNHNSASMFGGFNPGQSQKAQLSNPQQYGNFQGQSYKQFVQQGTNNMRPQDIQSVQNQFKFMNFQNSAGNSAYTGGGGSGGGFQQNKNDYALQQQQASNIYPQVQGGMAAGPQQYNNLMQQQVPQSLRPTQQMSQNPPSNPNFGNPSQLKSQQGNQSQQVFSGLSQDTLTQLDPLSKNGNQAMNVHAKGHGSQQSLTMSNLINNTNPPLNLSQQQNQLNKF